MRKDDSPCVRQAPEVEPVSHLIFFCSFKKEANKHALRGCTTVCWFVKVWTLDYQSHKQHSFAAAKPTCFLRRSQIARSSRWERLPNRRTALFRGAVRPGNFGWGRDVSEMIGLEKWDVIMYTCWRLTIWTIWTSKMTTPHNKTQHGRSKRLKPKIPHRTVRNYLETRKHKYPAITAVILSNAWNFDISSSSYRCNQGQLTTHRQWYEAQQLTHRPFLHFPTCMKSSPIVPKDSEQRSLWSRQHIKTC